MTGSNIRRLAAIFGVFAGMLFATLAFASPASAGGPTPSPSVSVSPSGNDECRGDVCKHIHWCQEDLAPGSVAVADVPEVVVEGGDTPKCVKQPQVETDVCCKADKGDVTVGVHNPNTHKFKVGVQVDNGTIQSKWLAGGEAAKFEFSGLANGEHVVSVYVWTGDKWCLYPHKVKVKVDCPSASPSPSVSHTSTPSPLVSTTPVSLPVTGYSITGPIVLGLLLVAGGGAMLWARKRRDIQFRA